MFPRQRWRQTEHPLTRGVQTGPYTGTLLITELHTDIRGEPHNTSKD